ncbi:MAG: dihydrodipicolinate synthase family protein [Micrococcus sp.]|nr:dihydrodipicolinate synthase family protein [Micrococcus sp.]
MPRGLSAFPLTPLIGGDLDEPALRELVRRCVAADVDSITVLGSTGCAAYLSVEQRRRVIEAAVSSAGDVPVMAGVSALSTRETLLHAEHAAEAGALAVMVAPMTYQPLTEDEVFGLYAEVADGQDLPIIVYDNPVTTRVDVSVDLYARISEVPGIAGFKIPPVTGGPEAMQARVSAVRAAIGDVLSLGISGDAVAAEGLLAGCDTWYSVLAGTLPQLAVDLVRAVRESAEAGRAADAALQPLWDLYRDSGSSLRAIAAIAEHLRLVQSPILPSPLRGLDSTGRAAVADVVGTLRLR